MCDANTLSLLSPAGATLEQRPRVPKRSRVVSEDTEVYEQDDDDLPVTPLSSEPPLRARGTPTPLTLRRQASIATVPASTPPRNEQHGGGFGAAEKAVALNAFERLAVTTEKIEKHLGAVTKLFRQMQRQDMRFRLRLSMSLVRRPGWMGLTILKAKSQMNASDPPSRMPRRLLESRPRPRARPNTFLVVQVDWQRMCVLT